MPLPSAVDRSTSKREPTSRARRHHEHVVVGQLDTAAGAQGSARGRQSIADRRPRHVGCIDRDGGASSTSTASSPMFGTGCTISSGRRRDPGMRFFDEADAATRCSPEGARLVADLARAARDRLADRPPGVAARRRRATGSASHGLPHGELHLRGNSDYRPARLFKLDVLRRLAPRGSPRSSTTTTRSCRRRSRPATPPSWPTGCPARRACARRKTGWDARNGKCMPNGGPPLSSRPGYVVVDNNLMTVPSDLRITHLNSYV